MFLLITRLTSLLYLAATSTQHRDLMSRYEVIHDWHSLGGVLLLGYSMFRIYSMPSKVESEAVVVDRIKKFLSDPGPSITIADEGHVLKNEKVKNTAGYGMWFQRHADKATRLTLSSQIETGATFCGEQGNQEQGEGDPDRISPSKSLGRVLVHGGFHPP